MILYKFKAHRYCNNLDYAVVPIPHVVAGMDWNKFVDRLLCRIIRLYRHLILLFVMGATSMLGAYCYENNYT